MEKEYALNPNIVDAFHYRQEVSFFSKLNCREQENNRLKLFENLPPATITFYGIENCFGQGIYFKTEAELLDYINQSRFFSKFDRVIRIDYFANIFGSSDVFRVGYDDESFAYYNTKSKVEYGKLDIKRSIELGMYVWETFSGNIHKYYELMNPDEEIKRSRKGSNNNKEI